MESPKVQLTRYELSQCMSCGCCLEACPQFNLEEDAEAWSEEFIGPHAISQARLFLHETGKILADERVDAISGIGGVSDCGNIELRQGVSEGVPLTESIAAMGRAVTVRSIRRFFTGWQGVGHDEIGHDEIRDGEHSSGMRRCVAAPASSVQMSSDHGRPNGVLGEGRLTTDRGSRRSRSPIIHRSPRRTEAVDRSRSTTGAGGVDSSHSSSRGTWRYRRRRGGPPPPGRDPASRRFASTRGCGDSVPRPRPVADLVFESGLREAVAGRVEHLGLEILVDRFDPSQTSLLRQGRAGFEDEAVAREVGRAEIEGGVQIREPVVEGRARDAEDEVEADATDSGASEMVDRDGDARRIVPAFERSKVVRMEGLAAHADPVDAGVQERGRHVRIDGLRVRLDRELLQGVRCQRANVAKRAGEEVGPQQGGRAAADEDGPNPVESDGVPRPADLLGQAIDERRLSIPLVDQRVEVAVVALVPAERDGRRSPRGARTTGAARDRRGGRVPAAVGSFDGRPRIGV